MRTVKRWHSRLCSAAISAALLIQSGCAGALRIPGQWLSISPPGDGRLEDFSRSITSHLFEDGMMVGLGNDADSLYVFFTPDMRRGRTRQDRARLTVWFDVQGGRSRRLGIEHVSNGPQPGHEPGSGMPGNETGPPEAGTAPGPAGGAERGSAPPASREFLKVIDRAKGREAFLPIDGAGGPALRLDSGWGDFTYQLRLPFRPAGDWPGLNVRAGQAVAVGFDWRVERRTHPRGKDRERPRIGPGDGGPGMGGMPAGGAMGANPPYGSPPLGKRRAWVRTAIAAR